MILDIILWGIALFSTILLGFTVVAKLRLNRGQSDDSMIRLFSLYNRINRGTEPSWVYCLARANELKGDTSKSIPLYKRLIELSPGDPRSYLDYARVLLIDGRIIEAKDAYSALQTVFPDENLTPAELENLKAGLDQIQSLPQG